jgi:hypothetical protein
MKRLQGNYGLYISVAILGVAIVASAFVYKKEADKAKALRADVDKWRDQLNAVRLGIPTEAHREFLAEQKTQIENDFQRIVREMLHWGYVPPNKQLSTLDFHGDMLTSIRQIRAAAQRNRIIMGPRARYLGFGEYIASPPRPEEDVLQLQREFSAAVDIVMLLIGSEVPVYSIDLMARGDDALVEKGTGTGRGRIPGELPVTRRLSTKYDFYETKPFRVKFSCTYPSLALFQKNLTSPNKVTIGNQRYPRNFLVVNDLWFQVQELETEGDRAREMALTTAYTLGSVGPVVSEVPRDLPGGELMMERDPLAAKRFFQYWNTLSETEKEIYRLDYKLRERLPDDMKEEIMAKRDRLRQELEFKRLPGRAPEYSIIEVTMLIDLVQFYEESDGKNKALADELPSEKPEEKRTASTLTTARR